MGTLGITAIHADYGDSNYIWLVRKGDQAVVVDPGEADTVIQALTTAKLKLAAILITHHHGDHVGGIAALTEYYADVAVYGPSEEHIPGCTVPLQGGARITLDALDTQAQVLAIPGHTKGHIAYFFDQSPPVLFCGDTLFSGGCGRVFEGTPAQMYASLTSLTQLPENTQIYCAHEYTEKNLAFAHRVDQNNPALAQRMAEVRALRLQQQPSLPTTLATELATNPFLRCHLPPLKHLAANAVDVFARLRQQRNQF